MSISLYQVVYLRSPQHSITQVEYLFTFYYGLIPHRHTSAELKAAMLSLGRPHTSHSNSFIIGDFNFVDTASDRPTGLNSGDTKIIPFWKAIPVIFRDAFRVVSPLKTVFSFQMKGSTVHSRIDRMYVSDFNSQYVQKFRYAITPFKDHKLQKLTFATSVVQGLGTWKMNTSVLTDALYQDEINALLNEMEAMTFLIN